MSDDQQSGDLRAIEERLEFLEFAVREQISRMYAIEQRLGLSAPVPRPSPPPIPQQPAQAQAPQPQFAPPPIPQAPKPHMPAVNLEEQIGGRWFNRIGVAAIVLAVGFFLKYAFDNEWIGPGLRVIIGLAGGVAMLLAGERFHRKGFRSYAQGISGGGAAILYLSIFAAYDFYQLIDSSLAFVCMALVTATTVVLALRQNALALAVLGVLGGFMTPVLLGGGRDEPTPLFGYLILLDAGVIALAYFKNWGSLSRLAFAATALLTAMWIDDRYAPVWFTRTFLYTSILFLLFVTATAAGNILRRRRANPFDLIFVVSNAVFYYVLGYHLIEGRSAARLGLFTLLVAVLYFALGEFARRLAVTDAKADATGDAPGDAPGNTAGDTPLGAVLYGLALLFLTIAIPVEFDGQWVTMLMGAESAALLWLGLRNRSEMTRGAALVVFAGALFHWLAVEVTEVGSEVVVNREFTFIFNRRVAAAVVLVAALAVAAALYRRYEEEAGAAERRFFGAMCALGAHLLVLFTLSIEAFSEFQVRRINVDLSVDEGWTEHSNLLFAQQMTLSLLWLVYGAGLLLYGIWRRNRIFRWAALGLLAVTIAKVFLVDLASLDRIYRIISFFALGAMLLVISYLYQRALRRNGGSGAG
ncbi:MAG: DUF2339 domain-containing protein [Blastocatellales bacterium]|nr:DUF2339 domain-containing protein [Blastocatellales bacterium]